MDSVQYRGSKDDWTDPLLGIEHHNDSYAVEAWRSSYTMVVWRGSSTVEAGTTMLILYWVLSTIMILRTRDVKFLHRGSAENVLYHVSMDDCAGPLLGIKHHNDSYTVAWGCSYTVEVLKRSYTVEA